MLDEGGGVVDESRPADCAYHRAFAGFRDPPNQSTSRDPSIPYPSPRAVRVPSKLETFAYTLVFSGASQPLVSSSSSRSHSANAHSGPRRRLDCSGSVNCQVRLFLALKSRLYFHVHLVVMESSERAASPVRVRGVPHEFESRQHWQNVY